MQQITTKEKTIITFPVMTAKELNEELSKHIRRSSAMCQQLKLKDIPAMKYLDYTSVL